MLIPIFLATAALGDVLVPGKPAPAISVDSFAKGDAWTGLEPGKVHVIEFWATWCAPCVRSIPHLSELQRSNPDVRFLGVAGCERGGSPEECAARVREFVASRDGQIAYPIAFDGDGSMFRAWMEAARRNTIPCAFVVGRDGNIAYVGSPNAELDKAIARAKEAPVPAVPARAPVDGKPIVTVEEREEPTEEAGSSTRTSVTSSSRSITVDGKRVTESERVETMVEVRDGKRRTKVTRTVSRSDGDAPVAGSAAGAASGSSSGSSSGASSGSSSSGSPAQGTRP